MFKNNFKTGRVIFIYIVFVAFGLASIYGIASAFISPSVAPPTAVPTETISGSRISGNIPGNAVNVTGVVPVSNGGTGATTATGAVNALLPSQVGQSGKLLSTDGSNAAWSASTSGVTSVTAGTGISLSPNPIVSSGTVTNSGVISVSCSSPLSCSGTNPASFSINQASSVANGYLSSIDWNTFNNKLSSGGTAANADLLDGMDSTAFLSTSSDYGRYNVSGTLYEGTTSLSGKYVYKSGDTMTGSLTAPALYDYNNTTYYIDPNFTGYSAYLAGSIGAVGPFYDLSNTTYYIDPASTGYAAYLNGAIGARTFVDLDNTGYGLDPNGTTWLNSLCLSGTCRTTWPAGGGTPTLDQVAAMGQTTSYWLYSPKFVDYSDSSRYVDPNGISELSSIQAWSGLNVNGNTYLGAMNQTPFYRLQLPNSASSAGQGVAYQWLIWSSVRWKENITPITSALSKVLKLRGVEFDWKEENGGKHDVGMIAEEVGKVIPELVSYSENGVDADALSYDNLTAYLVEAIKEQQKQIEELKLKVGELENK